MQNQFALETDGQYLEQIIIPTLLREQYDFVVAEIQLMQKLDDWVYYVTTKDAQAYKLKLVRQQQPTAQRKIEAVSKWLHHLNTQLSTAFAAPILNKTGKAITTLPTTNFAAAILYPWLEGITPEAYEPRKMYELGRLVAHMHQATTQYQGTPLPPFRVDHYWVISRVQPLLNSVGLLLNLSYDEQKQLSDNIEYLADYLKDLGYEQAFGWIHSDLHRNNLLEIEDNLTLLDFDDALQAHFMVDLGVLFNEFMDDPADGHRYRSSFLNGYQKVRPLDVPKKQIYIFQHIADLIYAHWIFQLAQQEANHPKLKYGWEALQRLIGMKRLV